MTSDEVKQVVVAEIGDDWDRSNAHGIGFDRCLIPPHKTFFSSPLNPNEQTELWIVLEEDPETCSGYKIVFDEVSHSFGLAIIEAVTERRIFLGIYGSFLETVDAM